LKSTYIGRIIAKANNMAKGFQIKERQPTVAEPEWDYNKIKQKMQGKSIVLCLPGRGCSYNFLKNFVQLCFQIAQNNMQLHIQQDYSSMVNFARCKVLGANVLAGPHQVPWQGQIEYDYQMWIDSDIAFTPENFWQLCDLALPDEAVTYDEVRDDEGKLLGLHQHIDQSKTRAIASGWYSTEDREHTACAFWLESDEFVKNKGMMNMEKIETMLARKKPFTCDYVGGGWLMVQKGVFESMEYPWWPPLLQTFNNGEIVDYCGEDVGFCLTAKEKGIPVWVDPRIRVGHEKTFAI
jgi:hypothetical protein